MSQLVETDANGNGVHTIRLNRPDKRNALSIELLETLCSALETATTDSAVRIIVLRGNGPTFCSGLDLKEAQDNTLAHRSAELVARALDLIYHAPQVTVCAVQGGAIAGGAGLMSCCDIAIAADDAQFGYPEVRRGLVAGLVMTFLRRQVPERFVRELLLTGELIGALRACEIGLITKAVPPAELDAAVDAACAQVLKGAPGALKLSKQFLDSLAAHSVKDDLRRALDLHVTVRTAGEAAEGFRAFNEKRKPEWDKG